MLAATLVEWEEQQRTGSEPHSVWVHEDKSFFVLAGQISVLKMVRILLLISF